MKLEHLANYVPSGSSLAPLSRTGPWTVIDSRLILTSHYMFLSLPMLGLAFLKIKIRSSIPP